MTRRTPSTVRDGSLIYMLRNKHTENILLARCSSKLSQMFRLLSYSDGFTWGEVFKPEDFDILEVKLSVQRVVPFEDQNKLPVELRA